MLQMQPWKIATILLICVLGFFTALPNFLPADVRDSLKKTAAFLPSKPVTLKKIRLRLSASKASSALYSTVDRSVGPPPAPATTSSCSPIDLAEASRVRS